MMFKHFHQKPPTLSDTSVHCSTSILLPLSWKMHFQTLSAINANELHITFGSQSVCQLREFDKIEAKGASLWRTHLFY